MCGIETRARLRLFATGALALGGVILIGMGLYFIFLRPALLPEDARFMGATAAGIQGSLPGLTLWLQRVFGVMGGFMVAAGLLTVHVALTTFRASRPGAAMIIALSGLASIGGMAVTNFAIHSDFRWLLLAFTLPWLGPQVGKGRRASDGWTVPAPCRPGFGARKTAPVGRRPGP